jgi:hypothetical protein
MANYDVDVRNAICDFIASTVTGGTLTVLDASNNVLATHGAVPAFGASAAGVANCGVIANATITAGGTAAKVRVTKGTYLHEFLSPGEVTFSNTTYVLNGESQITLLRINYPDGTL